MDVLMECLHKLQNAGNYGNTKIEIATNICDQFNANVFTDNETKIVKDILSALSHDIEKKTRKILSEKLCNNPNIPHEVAMRLAQDVLEIAAPILEFSSALTDDDLSEIIRGTKEAARLEAVSKRKSISSRIVDELLGTRNILVIKNMINNKQADFSGRMMARIINDYKNKNNILEDLVNRGGLPLSIVEKMITVVSEKLKQRLLGKYGISPEITSGLLQGAHEEMLLDSSYTKKSSEVDGFVKSLHHDHKLTYTLMLRALCKGDLTFFESSLAYLADIPVANAHKLIHDKSHMGFLALCETTTLPPSFHEATSIVLQFIIEEKNVLPVEDYSYRVRKKILDKGYDRTVVNMRYLLDLIESGLGSENIRHTGN